MSPPRRGAPFLLLALGTVALTAAGWWALPRPPSETSTVRPTQGWPDTFGPRGDDGIDYRTLRPLDPWRAARLAPGSRARLEFIGAGAQVSVDLPVTGSLRLDDRDLDRTRGLLVVDPSALAAHAPVPLDPTGSPRAVGEPMEAWTRATREVLDLAGVAGLAEVELLDVRFGTAPRPDDHEVDGTARFAVRWAGRRAESEGSMRVQRQGDALVVRSTSPAVLDLGELGLQALKPALEQRWQVAGLADQLGVRVLLSLEPERP